MTERRYRTARTVLEKHGFTTFQTTNRGTIAKLIDSRVFDLGGDSSDNRHDKQVTSKRQTNDEQATTNKERKEGKQGEEATTTSPLLSSAEETEFPPEVQFWNAQPQLPKVVKMTASRLKSLAERRKDLKPWRFNQRMLRYRLEDVAAVEAAAQ